MNDRREPVLGDLAVAGIDSEPRTRAARPANNRPRKPWLALILGLVAPLVAFAYAGAPISGIALVAFAMAVVAVAGWSGWIQSLAGFGIVLGVLLLMQLVCLVAPWLLARRRRKIYSLRWCNRWYVYLALCVVSFLLAPLFMQKERYFGFGTYRVSSTSMRPTMAVGDIMLVDTRAAAIANPLRGDIVIHNPMQQPDEIYVRRVVALPGQHVVVDANGVTVDGEPEPRDHLIGSDLPSPAFRPVDVTLGADEFYLMGDNRGNSFDSRVEGPYTRAQLRGKVTTIVYSHAWWRLGSMQGR